MELGLRDRVVLVTGGAKGIEAGIARTLAAEGAIPALVGRDRPDNEVAARALEAAGGRAWAVAAGLTRTDDCRAAVQAVWDQYGRIDGLVNNAGVNDGVELEHGDSERFMLSLRRNLVHYL